MTDELNISGKIFRPSASGVPDSVLGAEDSGSIDLSTVLDRIEGGRSGEGKEPSLIDSQGLLWPTHSGLHASLLSTSTRIGTAEAWQALAEELAEESQHVDDEQLRGALLCEAGRILIDRLGRQEEGELLMRNSNSSIAAALLDDGAGNVASLAAELAELEAAARDASKDEATRAAAWIEFGQLCEERTSSTKRALDAYQEALDLVPDHPVALAMGTDAALELDDHGVARTLIGRSLLKVESPRMRLALLLDLAELLDSPEDRLDILAQAHEADETEHTALRRLIRAVSSTADSSRLGRLYRKLAEISEDPISVSTALHLAFLTLVDAGAPVQELVRELATREVATDTQDILAPLAEVALYVEQRIAAGDDPERLPENIDVLDRLEKCLDDPSEQALVREQLARNRIVRLKTEDAEAPSPADTSTGLPKLSPDRSALCDSIEADLRFCLAHIPEHRWARDALADLLAYRKDITNLVVHLQDWARMESAGPARAAVLLRLGSVHEDLRSDLPRAAEVYELALAEEPDNTDCLRSAGRVYEKMRRWPHAVATLQRQAKETDDTTERLAALRRVALMAEHELHDVDLAVATLEEVAKLDPDDLLSLYQLAALCRSHGRAPILISTLGLLAERVDDDVARTGLLVELGEVQELAMRRRQEARECYERALSLSPGYTPALRALARLYREAGDIDALLGLFTESSDPITDPAVLHLKAARVAFEEAGDIDKAIELAGRSYETNPDLVAARELLMELLTASGRIEEAYDLLRAQDLPSTPPLLADYHYRLGLLAERLARAGDGDQARDDAALQHYRATLVAQPDHGLAFERARRLLVAYNDIENLVGLLRQQVEHAPRETKPVYLVHIGRLLACNDGTIPQARVAYEQATQAAPGDALVRREFEALLRRIQDQQSLPALYLATTRRTKDTHYKATLLVEAAELLLRSGAPEDRDVAANAILEALRDDPGNPYAVRHLERLLTTAQGSFAVKDAVSARAVRAQSDAERAIFYLESAELLELAGELEQARRAYHAAQDALPNLAPATLGLQRIASGRQLASAVTEVRTSVHVQMAEARDAAVRSGAGDSAAAARALQLISEVLDREPHHRDAIALARALAGQLADARPVLELLAKVFPRLEDSDIRYELGLFLGENTAHPEHAVHYFSAASSARPAGREALRGLLNAYRQMGDETRAAETTERLLDLFDPVDPTAVDLRLGLAAFLGNDPTTLARAVEHARIAVNARSDDPRAVGLLSDLLERSGARDQAAELLDRIIERERDRGKLHDTYLRKAKLLATMPGHEAQALASIESAAAINPGNRETITLLTELLDRTGQSERVSAYLQPIRGALLANISRGAVSLRDLRLLSHVASRIHPQLAEIANLVLFSIEPSSTEPPAGHMRSASAEGLRRVLQTPELRNALYASAEPPALHELLRAAEAALARLQTEFSVLSPTDAVPIPPSADPASFAVLLRQWSELTELGQLEIGAGNTHNAAVVGPERPPQLRLGVNLWMQGDPAAWRGCAAVAIARLAFDAPRARALPPIDMDLLLAACFETVEVFNAITADPDPRRLRELTALLGKNLPRRNRRAIERATTSLAARAFDPSATARATLTTDLRLATLISGDVGGCLAAACLLDGVAGASLKHRISRSGLAQELLVFLLSDSYFEIRAAASTT